MHATQPIDLPLDQPGTEASPRTIIRAACPHDCPDTCALHVTIENGRAVEVAGDPLHPTTRGTLRTKVARYLDRTYSDQRVLHPLRRVGRKGEGKFERISWDEALTAIAARFKDIAASTDGPEAILPYGYAGTMDCCNTGRWIDAFSVWRIAARSHDLPVGRRQAT
jgi:anaerobic selenocysteine-containing dehydrogenase